MGLLPPLQGSCCRRCALPLLPCLLRFAFDDDGSDEEASVAALRPRPRLPSRLEEEERGIPISAAAAQTARAVSRSTTVGAEEGEEDEEVTAEATTASFFSSSSLFATAFAFGGASAK